VAAWVRGTGEAMEACEWRSVSLYVRWTYAAAWGLERPTDHLFGGRLRTMQRCLSDAGSDESEADMLVFTSRLQSAAESDVQGGRQGILLHCHRCRMEG
jgi:hypothetical protein